MSTPSLNSEYRNTLAISPFLRKGAANATRGDHLFRESEKFDSACLPPNARLTSSIPRWQGKVTFTKAHTEPTSNNGPWKREWDTRTRTRTVSESPTVCYLEL